MHVLLFTGKGGVGKTTVAADASSLAAALRSVLDGPEPAARASPYGVQRVDIG